MARISLSKPITIGGEEVVVVRDALEYLQADKSSETFALVEPKGSDGRPPIYVSENDLTRMRDDYPGIKVYGLWQILFHNNLVKLDSPLITFPLTDSNGLYLLLEPKSDESGLTVSSSGEYVNGFIPDNYEVDLGSAKVIEIDASKLELPPTPALTRLEQSAKHKAESKRRWMVVGGFCALVVVATAATNYGLQTLHKSQMANYSTKKALVTELEDRTASLARERLIERPNDAGTIDRIYSLLELYPNVTTPPAGGEVKYGFVGEHTFITPPNSPVDPSNWVAGSETELLPTLGYVVRIQPADQFQDLEEVTE